MEVYYPLLNMLCVCFLLLVLTLESNSSAIGNDSALECIKENIVSSKSWVYPPHARWQNNGPLSPEVSGTTIRAIYDQNPPIFEYKEYGTLTGYNADLFQIICNTLNLKFKLVRNRYPGNWGIRLANGSWTGMLHMLEHAEADIFIGGASITQDKAAIVDFSLAIGKERYMMFIRTPSNEAVNVANYVNEFGPFIWILVVATWIILIVGVSLHIKFASQSSQNIVSVVSTATEIMFKATINKSNGALPSTGLPFRIVFLAAVTFSMILLANYRAQMNAFLSVSIFNFPVNNLQDALDKDFEFSYYKGGVLEETLLSSCPQHGAMYKVHQKNLLANPEAQNLTVAEKIQNVIKKNHIVLEVYDYMIIEKEYPCEVTELPNYELFHFDAVFLFAKGSKYVEAFNRVILQLKQNGILDLLHEMHFPVPKQDCRQEPVKSLGFQNVLSPFFVLGLGLVASLLLFMAELWGRGKWPKKLEDSKKEKSDFAAKQVKLIETIILSDIDDDATLALIQNILLSQPETC